MDEGMVKFSILNLFVDWEEKSHTLIKKTYANFARPNFGRF
jgi:hypothetical protein